MYVRSYVVYNKRLLSLYYIAMYAKCTYLSEQFPKTFVTLQIIGKLHSYIKVHVISFINYIINMITMHLLF